MLRHDNMVTTIRGRPPNPTAKEAVYPTTTDAPSDIRYGIMKTVITRALTGDSDQEIETWATEVPEAIAMVEVTEANETEKATERESDTGKKAQHKPEETGGRHEYTTATPRNNRRKLQSYQRKISHHTSIDSRIWHNRYYQ